MCPAKTGYYYISYKLVDHEKGGKIDTNKTSKKLFNKSGIVWNFTFSDTGKNLGTPRADWARGAKYTRPKDLASKYFKEYKTNTGKTLTQTNYDVHHIRPLFLGGDNSYSNLIHLPKDVHKKITGWYNGY